MKSFKPRQVAKLLEKEGFEFVRQKGSHRLYRKGDLRLILPYHTKDLKRGILLKDCTSEASAVSSAESVKS